MRIEQMEEVLIDDIEIYQSEKNIYQNDELSLDTST